VLYYNAATVETFDLTTMASFGLLMPAGSPLAPAGCIRHRPMAFGPDGNLYISGGTFGGIWRPPLQPDDGRIHRLLRQHRHDLYSQSESRLVPTTTFTLPQALC